MDLERQLYTILSGIESTYPNVAMEGAALPRITFQWISGRDIPDFSGHGGGARQARVQIDAWATTYAEARQLAEQARLALYAGLVVGAISDNPSGFELDTGLHRASFDIQPCA